MSKIKNKKPVHKTYKLRDYCLICEAKLEPSHSHKCTYCGGTFCDEHYNVYNHECQGDFKKGYPGGVRPTPDSLKYL